MFPFFFWNRLHCSGYIIEHSDKPNGWNEWKEWKIYSLEPHKHFHFFSVEKQRKYFQWQQASLFALDTHNMCNTTKEERKSDWRCQFLNLYAFSGLTGKKKIKEREIKMSEIHSNIAAQAHKHTQVYESIVVIPQFLKSQQDEVGLARRRSTTIAIAYVWV